jgi:hypothetical protein
MPDDMQNARNIMRKLHGRFITVRSVRYYMENNSEGYRIKLVLKKHLQCKITKVWDIINVIRNILTQHCI